MVNMDMEFDVCIIGSGAGAGPVALVAARAGKKVLILEKGGWFNEEDFTKDEIAVCRRKTFTPNLKDEPQVIESLTNDGKWLAKSNAISGNDFWNGSMVGGSSNLMSGFFHRMKPIDFRLKSEFGAPDGSNAVDWPISYEDMEPYYTLVEEEVGISGKVMEHAYLEPRSSKDFPYPPLKEHVLSKHLDHSCAQLGYNSLPLARAIISRPKGERNACSYSAYCGSYGCTTGAKGSSRAALLNSAINTGNCEIRPHSHVSKLITDRRGRLIQAQYLTQDGDKKEISATIFVIACQAIETSRLLLLSTGSKFPSGLSNNTNQVGKNLIFSAGGIGSGIFTSDQFSAKEFASINDYHLFINRTLQDWYVIDHPGKGRIKGGTIDFLMSHANPIRRAMKEKYKDGKLQWGSSLKTALEYEFRHQAKLNFEIFCDWTPTDSCFVSLSKVKDKFGLPVAKIRIGSHKNDLIPGRFLARKGEKVLKKMGAQNVNSSISNSPPANLVAGGCRFGDDPDNSVLDKDCRSHEVENLFITDGSFMPTGGSTTYTWTIYANAFRVAGEILTQL